MADKVPKLEIRPARPPIWERASIVWLVPVLALAVAIAVAFQQWRDRGPMIQIAFAEASGIHAGETELRYRDVAVGLVEDVGFSDNLGRVLVTVRLKKYVSEYVDDDSVFWIVAPQVTTQGVSGLDTVLSGVFIEAFWDASPDGLIANHIGQDTEPLLKPGEDGLTFTLRSLPDAVLSGNTPILHKGVTVGRIGVPNLAVDGRAATAEAVIYAPYDRLVVSATRFWDISGVSLSLGVGGAELDLSSLSSLIAGGIAFETMVSGGGPVLNGAEFDLYPNEDAARSSLFTDNPGTGVPFSILFQENVSGLVIGAPVELEGVQIGEVTGINGLIDPDRFNDRSVRLLVNVEILPGRIGIEDGSNPDETEVFLDDEITRGLRARLARSGFLSETLKIQLVRFPPAEIQPAFLDRSAEPFPIIPSTGTVVSDRTATTSGVLERLENLPIEQLMQSTISLLDNASAFVGNEELRRLPGDARGLLGDVRGLVGSDATQALPAQAGAVLSNVQSAAAELQTLIASLTAAKGTERLLAAIDAAAKAATSVDTAVAGVPELVAALQETATTARDLPLEALVTRTTSLVQSADVFVSADGTQNLPLSLSAALNEVTATLAELRQGNSVAALNQTLASAEAAAKAIETAANRLPQLASSLNTVLAQATETLEGLDANSDLSRAARAALVDVERAAESVDSLARALERRPNSILLGR